MGCQPKSRVPKILLYNHPWTKREQNGTHTKLKYNTGDPQLEHLLYMLQKPHVSRIHSVLGTAVPQHNAEKGSRRCSQCIRETRRKTHKVSAEMHRDSKIACKTYILCHCSSPQHYDIQPTQVTCQRTTSQNPHTSMSSTRSHHSYYSSHITKAGPETLKTTL